MGTLVSFITAKKSDMLFKRQLQGVAGVVKGVRTVASRCFSEAWSSLARLCGAVGPCVPFAQRAALAPACCAVRALRPGSCRAGGMHRVVQSARVGRRRRCRF